MKLFKKLHLSIKNKTNLVKLSSENIIKLINSPDTLKLTKILLLKFQKI